MGVIIKVVEHDKSKREIIVEAWNGDKRVVRSPVKYTTFKKKNLESLIRKGCKAFDSPAWGGFSIFWVIPVDE